MYNHVSFGCQGCEDLKGIVFCKCICNCILYFVCFGCSLYLGIICIQEWLPRLGDPKGIVTHPLGELQVLVSDYPDIKHLC